VKPTAAAAPLVLILIAVACGSPPDPLVGAAPDLPLVMAPIDAGTVVATTAPPKPSPSAATSEYLDLLRAIDTVATTPEVMWRSAR